MGSGVAAVFLDRDGTLIEDVGALQDPREIRLFPDTVSALRRLQTRFLLLVVTNQCAVAEGVLTLSEVAEVHRVLAGMLAAEGIEIAAWYVCPHGRDEGCSCRKPGTALLQRAVRDHGVDLSTSFVVGDHPSDALTGRDHGVRGVYVLTGHGIKHRGELPAGIPVFASIGDAAVWIDGER